MGIPAPGTTGIQTAGGVPAEELQAGPVWSGDWAEMATSGTVQGHLCKVYAFVMVLCYSRLMYLEFSLSSQLYDFCAAIEMG